MRFFLRTTTATEHILGHVPSSLAVCCQVLHPAESLILDPSPLVGHPATSHRHSHAWSHPLKIWSGPTRSDLKGKQDRLQYASSLPGDCKEAVTGGDPIVADPQPQDITILHLSDGLWHSRGKGSTVLLSPAMQCYKLVTNRQDRASIIDGSVGYRGDWV